MNKRIDKKRQKMMTKTPVSVPTPCECTPEAPKRQVAFYIQYQNNEYLENDIVSKVIEQCKSDGASDAELVNLSIYLKPEDKKVYYAYNEKNGAIDL